MLARTATGKGNVVQRLSKWDKNWRRITVFLKPETDDFLIDHNNTDLGTFSQFYYYSDEYWKGPGSPVILFTPGEENVTGYQSYLGTNRSTGLMAEKIGAAVVVLEHRYWGFSSPFAELTTDNMRYLTLANSIADLTNFANTAQLPFDSQGNSTASQAPWVLVGGSYSGALTAWTESIAPGTFWAYCTLLGCYAPHSWERKMLIIYFSGYLRACTGYQRLLWIFLSCAVGYACKL